MDKKEELIIKLLQDIEVRKMIDVIIVYLTPQLQAHDIQNILEIANQYYDKLHNDERELLIDM